MADQTHPHPAPSRVLRFVAEHPVLAGWYCLLATVAAWDVSRNGPGALLLWLPLAALIAGQEWLLGHRLGTGLDRATAADLIRAVSAQPYEAPLVDRETGDVLAILGGDGRRLPVPGAHGEPVCVRMLGQRACDTCPQRPAAPAGPPAIADLPAAELLRVRSRLRESIRVEVHWEAERVYVAARQEANRKIVATYSVPPAQIGRLRVSTFRYIAEPVRCAECEREASAHRRGSMC